MNRPKTSGKDLPPRMIRRVRTLVSGKRWVGYYYAGRDESGRRKEIPLGTDLNEAKRKWAELEIALKTWPDGWDGDEPLADTVMDTVYQNGSVQPLLFGATA